MRKFLLGLFVGLTILYLVRRIKAEKYNQERIQLYYQRRAKTYGQTDSWFAPRVWLRKNLLQQLNLRPGDKVLDLACGSGSNFEYIMQYIGSAGEIVGVDFSAPMLEEARKLADSHGWKNVRLIEHDAATVQLDEQFDVVLCTLGMVVIPDYKEAMKRAIEHVKPGGMLGIADLSESQRWYMQPVNVVMDVLDATLITDTTRRPWELMESEVENYRRDELIFGYMYTATGQKPA